MILTDLLNCTIRIVLGAGELLAAECELASGPRGYGDKAEVERLKPC